MSIEDYQNGDFDGITYSEGCAARLHMNNGDVWLRTDDGLQLVEGGTKMPFKFSNVVAIDFVRVYGTGSTSDITYIQLPSTTRFFPYTNVEEVKLMGVDVFSCVTGDKINYVADFFPKLKKLSLGDTLGAFDLDWLLFCGKLEEIEFPEDYYEKGVHQFTFSERKFPKEWKKDLQIEIAAHFPQYLEKITSLTDEECDTLYERVCDVAIDRAERRIERSGEPKVKIIRDEAETLEKAQNWVKILKMQNRTAADGLGEIANSNGFKYPANPNEFKLRKK